LAQFRAFTNAAERARRRELKEMAMTLRAAQYDKKGFTDYIRALDD
jgi:hypothetical protein